MTHGSSRRARKDPLGPDDRVNIDLDPEVALRALLAVDPDES
jgi:hypothetical protein